MTKKQRNQLKLRLVQAKRQDEIIFENKKLRLQEAHKRCIDRIHRIFMVVYIFFIVLISLVGAFISQTIINNDIIVYLMVIEVLLFMVAYKMLYRIVVVTCVPDEVIDHLYEQSV